MSKGHDTVSGEEVAMHERMRGFMRKGRRAVRFESRDAQASEAMLHCNYLLKRECVAPEA